MRWQERFVDYVHDGATVARAVTYAGYVGVLTGVRAGLSLSLNYRVRLGSPSSVLAQSPAPSGSTAGFPPLHSFRPALTLPAAFARLSHATSPARPAPVLPHLLHPDIHPRPREGPRFRYRAGIRFRRFPRSDQYDSIERKQCVSQMRGKARLTVRDVARQLEVQPVQNKCTHFSCVMDPAVDGGGLLWVRAYPEPGDMERDSDSDVSDSD
ncbi:hypothetical protein C8R47DRAFT_632925 [Mycena vitilis]|nr:hypothetical protein C8R47DRAFT_632925 [Mycena vitilis]